jgi:hypothetical protein
MSWGTCYSDLRSGTNNIHADFPPIMADGRNYANWQPGAAISENIRKNANITTNWQYRKYLTHNADHIVKFNQLEACDESCGNAATFTSAVPTGETRTPYIYKSTSDNSQIGKFGYENSNLKNLYLSEIQLQSRMVTPVFTQAQLLQQGMPRAN